MVGPLFVRAQDEEDEKERKSDIYNHIYSIGLPMASRSLSTVRTVLIPHAFLVIGCARRQQSTF